jgi:D-glycero-D-manno-heptose 1,7-bisphosphate phosphatase
MNGKPAIFLDRDGILNCAIIHGGKPYPPPSLENLEIMPGVHSVLKKLMQAGYSLIGITNQPDVARGIQNRRTVESINSYIMSHLPLLEIFTCYHDDEDNCECRKPRPGLIYRAAKKYGLNLTQSWMVGDRWKDIATGRAAGLKTVFVNYHYDEKFEGTPPDFSIENVSDLAGIILKGMQ